MSDFIKTVKDIFFVPKCKCCGRLADKDNLCSICREDMLKYRIPPSEFRIKTVFEMVDKAYAAYYYNGSAEKAVKRAKFRNPAAFLDSLIVDISIDIESILEENNIDMVTSVPYHKSKLYIQEYDLPQEMAKRIGSHFGLDYSVCGIKLRKTRKQHNLSKEKRKTNLAGAFAVNGDVKGKKILLIDDVITTGTTVSTYATELKFAGAEKVFVWAYTYNT